MFKFYNLDRFKFFETVFTVTENSPAVSSTNGSKLSDWKNHDNWKS